MTFFGRRHRSERGQGSLESVGVVTIAAILVASMVGVILQSSPAIMGEVSFRVCQIVKLGGGGGACEDPGVIRAADDHKPQDPCTVGSTAASLSATASVVVTVEKGYSFLFEELSDGTFRVTRVDSLGVGTGVGPGIDVSVTLDGKKYGVTAILSADVMLKLKAGETWYADSQSGVEEIVKNIIANEIVDQVAPKGPLDMIPNPINSAIKALIGTSGDPDESFVEGGIEGNAEATLSGITASAGAKISAEAYLGAKVTPDGYVAYFRGSVTGEVYAAVIGTDANASASAEALYEVVFDKGGKPQSMRMTAAVTLDAGVDTDMKDDQTVNEVVLEVPFDGKNDANNLRALSGNPFAMVNFYKAAKNDGYMSVNTYSQDPNTYGINVGGDWLGKYGGSISGDQTTKTLTDSLYWDGTQLVKRPDC